MGCEPTPRAVRAEPHFVGVFVVCFIYWVLKAYEGIGCEPDFLCVRRIKCGGAVCGG